MIHDVGAGGLSVSLPELVKDSERFGGKFELRQVESADSSMSPLQIWSNEAQERYVLLVNKDNINRFTSICRKFYSSPVILPRGRTITEASRNKCLLGLRSNVLYRERTVRLLRRRKCGLQGRKRWREAVAHGPRLRQAP